VLELCPARWSDYELLDCGNFQKLERFGKVITIRPEPQALWHPVFPEKEWEKQAHVRFIQKGSSSGTWKSLRSEVSSSWKIHYRFENGPALTFRLALTGFKHVGVFPEQAVNWDYIYNSLTQLSGAKFLNLFAYTGGASIAARAAGADVTHVDSIRQVVSWARENMEFSGLKDIRWVVEDALKFVKREAKRGHYYHGIILDPPAYGHGPEGEKWKLEEQLQEMMDGVFSILHPEKRMLILNAYSLGLSAMVTGNLFSQQIKTKTETGELFLQAKSGMKLPLGVFGRFSTIGSKD
jgi:23S rRNA (cytosine1962-C5)-methyltransferase